MIVEIFTKLRQTQYNFYNYATKKYSKIVYHLRQLSENQKLMFNLNKNQIHIDS